jgi:hypothetical protein
METGSFDTQIDELLLQHSNGETDLALLARALWHTLYEQIPYLTASKNKEDQHSIFEGYLVSLGLPRGSDLQYVAGPMLWYAREHGVLPPAQSSGSGNEPWALDRNRYEKLREDLDRGFIFYGDWMTSALKDLLNQQH